MDTLKIQKQKSVNFQIEGNLFFRAQILTNFVPKERASKDASNDRKIYSRKG